MISAFFSLAPSLLMIARFMECLVRVLMILVDDMGVSLTNGAMRCSRAACFTREIVIRVYDERKSFSEIIGNPEMKVSVDC